MQRYLLVFRLLLLLLAVLLALASSQQWRRRAEPGGDARPGANASTAPASRGGAHSAGGVGSAPALDHTAAAAPHPPPGSARDPGEIAAALLGTLRSGFSGSVPYDGGTGACSEPGGAEHIAEPVEVATWGPMLHRGGCRWSLAGVSWCPSDGSCTVSETEEKLRALAAAAPDCGVGLHREPRREGGALDIVRTPGSRRLVEQLAGDWVMHIGWCGAFAARCSTHLPVEEVPGRWRMRPEMASVFARERQVRRVYVPIMFERHRDVMSKGRLVLRTKRTRTRGRLLPEVMAVTMWTKLAGDAAPAVEHVLRSHLMKVQARQRGHRLLTFVANTVGNSTPCPCKLAERTVVMPRPSIATLLENNVGHWANEALFNLFNARPQPGERAALWPGDDWDSWFGFARHSEALTAAVSALVPLRTVLARGACLLNARLYGYTAPPAPGSLGGVRRFVRPRLSLPPEPLPAPEAGRLTATLLLRFPGGTRFISNWREARTRAAALGWDVLCPLDPSAANGTRLDMRLTEAVAAAGRSHALIAMHGAELGLAAFAMAAGSVLVEVCVGANLLRWPDLWFISYAFTSGVHVVRWMLPVNATRYADRGPSKPADVWRRWVNGTRPGPEEPRSARFPTLNMWVDMGTYAKRIPSDTELPLGGWDRLLSKLRRLLERQHQGLSESDPVSGLPADAGTAQL